MFGLRRRQVLLNPEFFDKQAASHLNNILPQLIEDLLRVAAPTADLCECG
jgi:hypothetical protein